MNQVYYNWRQTIYAVHMYINHYSLYKYNTLIIYKPNIPFGNVNACNIIPWPVEYPLKKDHWTSSWNPINLLIPSVGTLVLKPVSLGKPKIWNEFKGMPKKIHMWMSVQILSLYTISSTVAPLRNLSHIVYWNLGILSTHILI